MRNFFTFCFLTIVHWQICQAQVVDSFDDGNFTDNPSWNGNTAKFAISSGQLKLQAEALASTAYLSTESQAINNASWQFLVQLDFNPSSTNLTRIYLVSDQADLTTSLHGYFVKIGNTADEVSLYRQDGLSEIKIIDGLDKTLNTSTVKARVTIKRDDTGNWQLLSDIGATGSYISEGNCTDTTYTSSSYFGVHCKYTSTRADKFHFDDFNVSGNPFKDNTKPTVDALRVISSTELELVFSEIINAETSADINNYHVTNAIGNPATATLFPDQKTIRLTFSSSFPNGVPCQLMISNITDLSGNVIVPVTQNFQFFEPHPTQFRDIVITEILPDPDPQILLPNVEFIELYNRSENPVDLADWVLTDGSSVAHFTSVILMPGEYLIVTSSANASSFGDDGKVTGVQNFPTLNNDGDAIVLKNSDAITLDSINYTSTWYGDADKKQGGWTLEKIDPNNICAEAENWIASADPSGGTPGKQNSVYANKPDLTAPRLLSAFAESPTSIRLQFTEKLEKILPVLNTITLEPAVVLSAIEFKDGTLTSMLIKTTESLKDKTAYKITASTVYDCAGNVIDANFNQANFGLPESADSLDIVVNEILFNPTPTGVDFVEIYNRSSKYIDLSNWSLANVVNELIENQKSIPSSQLPPNTYAVFSTQKNILKSEYPQTHEDAVEEMQSLPSMNDDEGSIAIINATGNVIDALTYSKNMHSPFIQNDEGVSLERIQFDAPTSAWQNWKSASASAGFATPGFLNSNARANASLSDETVKVDPEIFMPSLGNPNFTEIKYNFNQGNYMANVKIVDLDGRDVKQLASNESLSTQGFFRWDGDLDNGTKAAVGYYVVRFEVFNASGVVKTFHKRVVVATRF